MLHSSQLTFAHCRHVCPGSQDSGNRSQGCWTCALMESLKRDCAATGGNSVPKEKALPEQAEAEYDQPFVSSAGAQGGASGGSPVGPQEPLPSDTRTEDTAPEAAPEEPNALVPDNRAEGRAIAGFPSGPGLLAERQRPSGRGEHDSNLQAEQMMVPEYIAAAEHAAAMEQGVESQGIAGDTSVISHGHVGVPNPMSHFC